MEKRFILLLEMKISLLCEINFQSAVKFFLVFMYGWIIISTVDDVSVNK